MGLRVEGLEFRVYRVSGLGLKVLGQGPSGLGLRVEGLGWRVCSGGLRGMGDFGCLEGKDQQTPRTQSKKEP